MKEFPTYFGSIAVAVALADLRAGVARKRRANYFWWQYSDAILAPEAKVAEPQLAELLPPRRQWRRPNHEGRRGLDSATINKQSIMRLVLAKHHDGTLKDTAWGEKLVKFTENIGELISEKSPGIKLTEPIPVLIDKGGTGSTNAKRYRAVVSYKELTDRIILRQTRAYLQSCFDPLLSDSCFAFRSDRHSSYSLAIAKLLEYRKRFKDRELYIAESDIKRFFDTIHHDVVRKAVSNFSKRLTAAKDIIVHPKALEVVEAYLNSYNVIRVITESQIPEIRDRLDSIDQTDSADLISYYADPLKEPLGIPQGGSLSPLLANIVLDHADQAVLSAGDPDLFYVRFCDDMLILHPDPEKCHAAQQRYLRALDELRLPYHQIEPEFNYGRKYYEMKSKAPHKWGDPAEGKNISPWVSFVGYQVHYLKGNVRIREESLRKHTKKLQKEIARARSLLINKRENLRCEPEVLVKALKGRLVAAGTGKSHLRLSNPEMSQPCWIDAFPLLESNIHSCSQMRRLDRRRHRLFSYLDRLAAHKPSEESDEPNEKNEPVGTQDLVTKKANKQRPFFWGKPYSYYGYLERTTPILRCVTRRESDYFD